ncbi:MAG: hypothetical protein K8F91_27130, partial [Candidatus Obscuribacterales bacterium]|nr:hypothetical protein [Candidatus Obscuribacterales bacterium]
QIAGVPIFPQTQPHLVDIGQFDAATTDPIAGAYLPPNAFRANSQALEGSSGNLGSTAACAIVGALDSDFPVSMPRGYVRIINGEDANAQNTPITNPVINGTNDIFNTELWPPSKLMVSNVGGNTVYTRDQAFLGKVKLFNDSDPSVPVAPTTLEDVYQVTSSAPYFVAVDRSATGPLFTAAVGGSGPGVTAAPSECDTDTIWTDSVCNADPSGLNPGSMPHSASAAYGKGVVTGGAPANGYTNIEYMKASLLNQRANGAKCATVNPPAQPSGMKKFVVTGCYNTPNNDMNFGQVGSPIDYIDQISDGGTNACATDIVQFIADRMSQVDHTIDVNRVRGALATNLALGQTMALYSPGPGQLVMNPISPGQYFQTPTTAGPGMNDGKNSAQVVPCENTYSISDTIINSKAGGGSGVTCATGDAGYHDRPFTSSDPITAIDRCTWTPASGWRNLLGDIKFENTAQNGGTFCKPN